MDTQAWTRDRATSSVRPRGEASPGDHSD